MKHLTLSSKGTCMKHILLFQLHFDAVNANKVRKLMHCDTKVECMIHIDVAK